MKVNRFRKDRKSAARREALPRGMKDPWEGLRPAKPLKGRSGDPGGLLVTLALAAAVAGAGLFHVWTRSEHLRLGYAIVAAESRVRAADGEKARLDVEVASLTSPSRIAKVASERLHLRVPDAGQVIDLPGSERDSGQAVASTLASAQVGLKR